jgi:indole-3-glycerol phosphate synthase
MLNKIMAHKAEEVAARKKQRPLVDLERQMEKAQPGLLEAAFLSPNKPRIMLELKPASPSAGVLKNSLNDVSELLPLVRLYVKYGVAISVLTDEKYFGGSLDLLRQVKNEVKNQVQLPLLRKDFILDPYQVAEARLAGADAVLLIVKALSDLHLQELTAAIREWGMTPLIEIQDEHELERALTVKPTILLINNRDLQTLQMDMTTTSRLAPLVPDGILRVSASGIESRADIDRLQPVCDGFLVGSLLMRQPSHAHLENTLRELSQ